MRMSDWSSDVCSSDLVGARAANVVEAIFGRDGALARQKPRILVEREVADERAAIVGTKGGAGGDGAEIARVIALLGDVVLGAGRNRSEEHTSELQSLMSSSYDVFC